MRITINSLRDGKSVEVFPGLFIFCQNTTNAGEITSEAKTIMPHDTHTGFGYCIMQDSFLEKVQRTYSLERLDSVAQLSYLQDPDTPPQDRAFSIRFTHTRLAHSLDVAALAAVIIYNNQEWFDVRPGHDLVLLTAALTHDVLTPAGGDTTKSIDFAAFDEDVHYPETIKEPGVAAFLQKHSIDPDLLCATIRGKGPLGSILDLVDKLAYTRHDVLRFEGSTDWNRHSWGSQSPSRAELTPLVSSPNALAVWQDVVVDDDGVLLKETGAFVRAFLVRASMFRLLYTRAEARFHESLIAHTILSFLYDTEQITREYLLSAWDCELTSKIDEILGERFMYGVGHYDAQYRAFDTMAEAREFERSLVEQGHWFVQTENVGGFFKPGTHFRVETENEPKPFSEYDPVVSKKIMTSGAAIDPIRVYYFEGRQPVPEKTWAAAFETWRQKKLENECGA